MFSAYSWFNKAELFAAVRAATLAWVGNGEKVVTWKTGAGDILKPEQRNLTPPELAGLKKQLETAWEDKNFGGFISGTNLSDLKGWYHFKLNVEKITANLENALLDPALADFPPLQNPALHLALIALLKEYPQLESISLPFGEICDLDREALKMFWLAPGDAEGHWLTRQEFQRKTDFLSLMSDLVTPGWYEIKLQVEPGLARLVFRLFNRYGHPNKTRLEATLKTGLLGEEIEDETGPYTIVTFLPKNERFSQNLADLQTALRELGMVSPIPELEIKEVSRAGSVSRAGNGLLDEEYSGYRVGRHFIIHLENREQPGNEPRLAEEDRLIRLYVSGKGFGPQRKFIHPTSQVALELLEERLDPAQHAKVLDLGTGTGALAIAAARRGIPYILAIEPDREVLKLAQENVVLNGLQDRIVLEAGSLGLKDSDQAGYIFAEELQQRPPSLDKDLPFDAILANIFGPNLITLAGAMSEALRPGGLLISSGIAVNYLTGVTTAFRAAGLEILERREVFGWFGFVHRKI